MKQASATGAGGNALAGSPAGDQIAMPADGGTVRLWQLRPLQEEAVVATGIDTVSAGPDALAFSSDGKRLAVGRGEAGGRTWTHSLRWSP